VQGKLSFYSALILDNPRNALQASKVNGVPDRGILPGSTEPRARFQKTRLVGVVGMNTLIAPVELTDAELDLVAAGAVVTGGLVNLTLTGNNIQVLDNILNNNTTNVSIRDVANNNTLGLSVGAIIQLLGGPAAILQHQAA
jgi:hypothetical protein